MKTHWTPEKVEATTRIVEEAKELVANADSIEEKFKAIETARNKFLIIFTENSIQHQTAEALLRNELTFDTDIAQEVDKFEEERLIKAWEEAKEMVKEIKEASNAMTAEAQAIYEEGMSKIPPANLNVYDEAHLIDLEVIIGFHFFCAKSQEESDAIYKRAKMCIEENQKTEGVRFPKLKKYLLRRLLEKEYKNSKES